MKKLNRKKLIEEFEFLRQGFDNAVRISLEKDDTISVISFASYYHNVNRMVVELGGESYNLSWVEEYYKSKGEEPCEALKYVI